MNQPDASTAQEARRIAAANAAEKIAKLRTRLDALQGASSWDKRAYRERRQIETGIARFQAWIESLSRVRLIVITGRVYGAILTPVGEMVHVSDGLSDRCGCGAGGQLYAGRLVDSPITCIDCAKAYPDVVKLLGYRPHVPKPAAGPKLSAEQRRLLSMYKDCTTVLQKAHTAKSRLLAQKSRGPYWPHDLAEQEGRITDGEARKLRLSRRLEAAGVPVPAEANHG